MLPVKPKVIPKSFETARLLIRAPRRGDGLIINEAVLESLEDLRPWMPWAQTAPTVADSESLARKAERKYRQGKDLPFNVYLKASGELVGRSGLHRVDWSVPRFEIGYWCRTRFQGQGYITEAVRGITRFAFDTFGAQRVEILCDTRNEKSRAVAERAGFTLEGVLRNDERATDGSLRDTAVFALTPEEYGVLQGNAHRAQE